MTLFEDNTQVFIVRIWLERRNIEGAPVEWRGVIERITPGNDRCGDEKRYVKSLDDVVAFIAPYLQEMGVKLGFRQQLSQWLKQWRR